MTDSSQDPRPGGTLIEAARLFNEKLYFECHDVLEDAWSGARGDERAFLHGLLHVAVGMVHVSNANHRGAVNLLERAERALAPFAPNRDGLDVASLLDRARTCLEKSRRGLAGAEVEWEPADVPRMEVAALE